MKNLLSQTLIRFCFSLLIFSAVTNAMAFGTEKNTEIDLPSAKYTQPVSDQGFVMRSPSGQWCAYWADGALKRYPSIKHNIYLDGHRLEYTRWNTDKTQFIMGSASGDNGKGWAWVVDVKHFTVLNKLEGNIAAAWFQGSAIAFIKTISNRQIYVCEHKRKWLPYSVMVTASTEDGKYWLARTSLRHDHGYRGDLVIMGNDNGTPKSATVVRKSIDFPDEPSELITSDGSKSFVIALCRNQSHIGVLSDAIYVDLQNHDAKITSLKTDNALFFFDFNVYRSSQGFAGIYRTIDDHQNNAPIYTGYRYIINHGRVIKRDIIHDKILAYSADVNGNEIYILERNGKVFLHQSKIKSQ